MITSNFALEFKKDGVIATAVHPGWVRTDMGGPNALIGTEESAVGIMNILTKLEGEEGTGKFYHAIRGDTIGWWKTFNLKVNGYTVRGGNFEKNIFQLSSFWKGFYSKRKE